MIPDTAVLPAKATRFTLLLSLVVLIAFAVREYFVLASIVDDPIRGDIRDYVSYAWNLVNYGVFSQTMPDVAVPMPDGYRSPGYPWLLALCMAVAPRPQDWYALALQMQVVLGSATVLVCALLARQWLNSWWSLFAGLLLALWPHHIAATGALLSEVVFGFALMMALYAFARAWNDGHSGWFVATGAAFGYAFLVNPLIAMFPLCLASMLLWLGRGRAAALLLAVFLIPVLALGLRNAQLPTPPDPGAGRAALNFVQGSWPIYHAAHRNYYTNDPNAIEIMGEISREAEQLQRDPRAGLTTMIARMRHDPSGYTMWYLWWKPQLLWGWDIRSGAGSHYFNEVKRSPLETNPLLRGSVNIVRSINPWLTALSLAAAFTLLFCGWRRTAWVPAATTGALAAYLTVLHTTFQAEPRYANAYRGIEVVLVATALAAAVHFIARALRAARGKAALRPGN